MNTSESGKLFQAVALAVLVILLLATPASAAEKMKIISDSDLAGDIDDAIAHALVQVSPELDVLGITLCDGPTDLRARVSCRMLYECGQERIPVAVGKGTPTSWGDPLWGTPTCWGDPSGRPYNTLGTPVALTTRWGALRKYPGQVTIISVGPVTNLADVIARDPAAWKMVKEVYSMFGSFFMGYNGGPVPDAEWNVRADVESAKKFMNSGFPITLAGLDVTTMVKYTEE